jgi:hypothetical protein
MTYLIQGKELDKAEMLAKKAFETPLKLHAFDTLAQIYQKKNEQAPLK